MKIKLGFNLITLFLVFLVLKLTGIVGWSWWAITAPLWGPFAVLALLFAMIALTMIGYFLLCVMAALSDRC